MNYYEELGIRSDADEEEIRKAHRRLVKLMHPDQHRDQGMKQLAETQMRRLNSIVSTLLDPEERREYDDELRGADAVNAAPRQSTWRSVPWWIASTLGAIVLTVGAVWFFADRIGSRFDTHSNPPAVIMPDAAKPDSPKKDEVPTVVQPAQTAPPAFPPEPPPESIPAVASKGPATPLRETILPKRVEKQPQGVQTSAVRKFAANLPPITVLPKNQPVDVGNLRPPAAVSIGVTPSGGIDFPRPEAPGPPVQITHSRDPLEGEWVYAPTSPEKQKPGFYPPEFIQLKLRKDTSGMRGEYSARYSVADNRPVSPNVNFELKAVDDKAMKYVWTGADGSHGWFVIRQLEPDMMRLEWRDTSRRNGQAALTSGMATLVRKN